MSEVKLSTAALHSLSASDALFEIIATSLGRVSVLVYRSDVLKGRCVPVVFVPTCNNVLRSNNTLGAS